MSRIINEPNNHFPLFVEVRKQLEHRALWLYLLVDEAEKRGLEAEDFAAAAIGRCGLYQGKEIKRKSKAGTLRDLRKRLFTRGAQAIFEMKVLKENEDELSIDFHYCPLVKAWQKQGLSDERIEQLCNLAMCGDRGIGEIFGAELELPKTIARGDDHCAIRFIRRT